MAANDQVNEYFVFTNMETGADLVPQQANFHHRPQAIRARFRPGRILWEQIVLPMEASRFHLDVMFNPGFTAPLAVLCRTVTTFHDLQHKRHSEYFRWFDLPFWRFLLWTAAHRSQKLIAVSEATRADLLHSYRIPPERVSVIHHGVDPSFFALDRSPTEPYLLCVSTLHPHKNLERLVRAFARKKRPERMVLAGMRGFQASAIESVIQSLEMKDRVEITGWLPRKDLLRLYKRAQAFVYPSTFEGFGMPVLEALAAGIPVACSNIAPIKEVAGDAALFFDPLDEEAIAAAVDQILNDQLLRARLAQAGPERARPFTWRRTAEKTLKILLSMPGD
jgi:glycosyltransferase involved in cell wall biosynthesis